MGLFLLLQKLNISVMVFNNYLPYNLYVKIGNIGVKMGLRESVLSIMPKGMRDFFEKRHQKRLESQEERMQGYLMKGLDPKRWSYEIQTITEELPFIRPNDPNDIAYRDYWRGAFPDMLRQNVPEGLDLRFHGTTIAKTKAILASGGIFSSVDINDGYRTSTDLSGQISTTCIETVQRSLEGWFTDMGAYIRSLPCGCLFVLNPRTQEDQNLKQYDSMESVNFREHPEQLRGIITSPENISRVQEWLLEANLNPALVYDFEGFIKQMNYEKTASKAQTFDERYHYDVEPITQRLDENPTTKLNRNDLNITHEEEEYK